MTGSSEHWSPGHRSLGPWDRDNGRCSVAHISPRVTSRPLIRQQPRDLTRRNRQQLLAVDTGKRVTYDGSTCEGMRHPLSLTKLGLSERREWCESDERVV